MTLLEMTLSGSLMILIITVVRAVAIDRLPKRVFPALWGVTLLRLLIPFSVPVFFSLPSPAGYAAVLEGAPSVAEQNKEVIRAARQAARAAEAAPSRDIPVWQLLWLAGVSAALLFFVIAYIRHLRRFRDAVPVETGFTREWLASHPLRRPVAVRESGSVTTPLTYGIFRPVVLMPAGTDWENAATLSYVFAHEYTHIRRFDALLRLVLTAALCVHWFNPLVWVMYLLALRDIELSCDEAVVRQFGLENRRAYALALLKMEETRLRFSAFASGFSRNAAWERIRAIMKTKKTTARQKFASVLLAVCVCALFCTSAAAAEPTGLRETPDLIRADREEMLVLTSWRGEEKWTPPLLSHSSGRLARLREGDFIKLEITGKGGVTLAFLLYCESVDELKGQMLTLGDGRLELWLQAPADGEYYLWVVSDSDDWSDYYTYTVNYTMYTAGGERMTNRWNRWKPLTKYDGSSTHTYTRTVD